jgi:hypothetical protein
MSLKLGPSQGYWGLSYHMEEAYLEKNIYFKPIFSPPIAIFSNKYYNELCDLNHEKVHDYCFIGSINSWYKNRKWVIEFAKKYFTSKSIFINTDNDPNWVLLGDFDYSNKNLGYCPKNQQNNQSKNVQYRVIKENLFYFETMCKSKYVLCPAGDTEWSFRFYETLMCKTLPIVISWHHTYRTKEEAKIKYKYLLVENIEEHIKKLCDEDYNILVSENTKIFQKYHMLN